VTGLASLAEGLSAKWLELLRQTVSGMARVGVLMEPGGTAYATFLREIKTVGQQTGIAVVGVEARGRDEIERAFAALTKALTDGTVDWLWPAAERARQPPSINAHLTTAAATAAGGLMKCHL
jgi:ABC-type uncharacterized transport system substrate-binding protein